MEETLDIQQQVPQQEDPPRKKLWGLMRKKELYTKSYEDFESQFSTPEKIDKLHKFLLDKEIYTKTTQDFKTQFFSDKQEPAPSKKKVGTVTFGETYSSPELDSETPSTGKIPQVVDMGDGVLLPDNPILLSRKYNELKGRKKTIPQVGGGSAFAMGTGSIEIPDEDAVNLSKKIKEYLDGIGIDPDQISSEFKGVRDEDINIHGEELLADRKQNPQLYQRKLGRLKWKRGLNEELLKSVESGRLNNDDYNNISASIKSSLENSSVGDYKQQRENVNSVANAIKQFGGENKEQLLKEYAIEVSKVYGNSYNFGFGKTKEETPESKYLTTPEAQLGYDYIKDLSPEKAEQYKRLFVDAKSLKDKPEEQKGYNHLMQTLEETGIGLIENSVNEELNFLKTIAKKTGGLTPEQINKANQLEEKLSELNQKKTELDSKYPDRINDKVDDAIQEILGQNLSWWSYAAGSAGKAFKNTAQGVWEAVSTPFMSDESNRLRELYIMGQSLDENKVYHKTDANKALVTDTLVIKPELQLQIDAIKNDKTLSREQKELKLYPLLKNNSDKFGRVSIQGGKFNVNPSSILYGVTDLGITLLPFIALETATGGIGGAGAAAKFLRTFTAAAATSFHDEYANAILEGKSESDAYKEAMGITAINSFAMAGAGTPEAVRSMAGLKTSAGQIISRMSDAEIKKVLERGTKSKALNALKDRISATPEMIKKGAESGAKSGVAMNAAQEAKGQLYNTEIDREEQFKHNLLNIANFSLLGGVLGHVGYKSPSNLQKSGLIEFGKNPDGFLASIEQMKKEGALSQADFDQRKGLIEKSAEAYKSLPQLNDKGKPLSTKEQGEILYNTVIKNEGKKAASTLPPQQAEKAEMKSMVADYANGIILENPTDKQLESRKSTLEKQIEGKDENGKPLLPEKELLKAKAQLEAVNDAIQRKENGVEVQAPINTGESIPLKTEEQSRNENGIVVEKPMVVPEPITISSEPTKTQPTNEAKAKASTVSGSALKDVGDVEYNDFIDKGKVSDERLNDIAEKVKTQQPLSDREKEIFTDKTAEINKIISKAPTQYTEAAGGSALKDVGKGEPLNTNEEAKLKELYKKSFLKQEMTPQEQQEFVDLKNKKNEFKRKQALDNQLEEGANVNGDWVSIHSGGYKKMGLFYSGENWEVNIQNRLNNNILTIRKRNPKTGELEIIHQSDHKTEQGAIEEYKKHNKGIEDEINARFDDKVEKPQAPTQYTEAAGVSGSALKDVESFETSQGSVYKVGEDGKTSRFKTKTGEQKEPQDLTVFAKFEGQQADDYLQALHGYNGETVHVVGVIDGKVQEIKTNEDAAKATHIKLTIVDKDGKITDKIEASNIPVKGYNVFDQRKISENKYEKHIGNEVSKINYKPKAPTQYTEAATPKSENKPIQSEEAKANDIPVQAEVKEPTITEPNKVGEEAETAVKKEEQPPVVPPIPPVAESEGAFVEPPEISFRKDSFVRARNKVGIDEFVDESKTTHIAEATKAQRTVEEWKEDGSYAENIADIQERALKGQISNQEKFIFAKHLADLDATVNAIKDVNSKEYDVALGEYNKALNAADAARSEAGRQLGMIPKNRGTAQTLADVMVDMMNDNNADVLTPEQKKTAEKRYEKVKEAFDKEAALRIEIEAEAEKLRAENALLKKQVEGKGKPKEGKVYKDGKRDFDAETKNYKDELKKLAEEYKAAGQKLGISSDGGGESFVISAKMAKVVMKIVGVKVEQMGVKLKEVTEATLKEVKDIFDGITERDIRDIIAGKYNEKKATKNDLLSQMHDLKQEQKLLFELEALENGGTPKTEKALKAKNQRLKELRDKIDSLKKRNGIGKYSDEAKFISAAKSRIEANKKKQQEISDKIKNKEFSEEPESKSILDNTELQKKHKKLYEEYQKSVIDKEKALFQYEQERIDDKIRNYNLAEKVGHWAELAFHTSKGSVAIFDQSGLLVQLIQTTLSHPWESVKNIIPALRDLITPKQFDANMAKLKQSKYWDLFQKMDLPLYDTHSHDINFRNDLLGGDKNLMNKDIVINGKKMSIGKAFERSTATLFNNIRVKLATEQIEKLHREGKTWENSPEEFKQAARVIAEFTGHGKVHKAFTNENWNILIWSSKMLASTFNVLGLGDLARPVSTAKAIGKGLEGTKVGNLLGIKNISIDPKKSKGFYSSLTPQQRKFAVKEMSRFIAAGATLLAAAYLKGQFLDDEEEKTTVDVNPLSTDFGTIKSGNKTVNVYGRFSSAVGAIAQIMMGVRYLGGREDVLGDKYGDKSRADIAFGKFGRGKMTPLVGLGYDYFFNNKKNYFTKEDITATGALKQAISPLAFQDVAKDIKRNDPALSVALWTLFKVYGGNVRDRRDYISQDLKMPEWKFLNEKGLKLSDKSKESLNPIDKEGKPIEVTEEKYKEFLKKREEYVRQDIEKLMRGEGYIEVEKGVWEELPKSKLKDITYDEIKGWLMTKTNQANDRAMMDVFEGEQAPKDSGKRKIETQ